MKPVANKTMWVSIVSSEMMRDTYKAFLKELLKYKTVEFTEVVTAKRIYIKCVGRPVAITAVRKMLSSWGYYNPVSICRSAPRLTSDNVYEERRL